MIILIKTFIICFSEIYFFLFCLVIYLLGKTIIIIFYEKFLLIEKYILFN
jgi:hypothetical protein